VALIPSQHVEVDWRQTDLLGQLTHQRHQGVILRLAIHELHRYVLPNPAHGGTIDLRDAVSEHGEGVPVAAAMYAAGHAFYQAANGVWLTDHVPPGDLSGWPG
jgi:hypothetical protein